YARTVIAFIKHQSQFRGRLLRRGGKAEDAQMRSVQLTHHETHQGVQILAQSDVLHQRPILRPHRFPVRSVEGWVVEMLAQRPPTLLEHLPELFITANRHLGFELDSRRPAGKCEWRARRVSAPVSSSATATHPRVNRSDLPMAIAEIDQIGGALRPLN